MSLKGNTVRTLSKKNWVCRAYPFIVLRELFKLGSQRTTTI